MPCRLYLARCSRGAGTQIYESNQADQVCFSVDTLANMLRSTRTTVVLVRSSTIQPSHASTQWQAMFYCITYCNVLTVVCALLHASAADSCCAHHLLRLDFAMYFQMELTPKCCVACAAHHPTSPSKLACVNLSRQRNGSQQCFAEWFEWFSPAILNDQHAPYHLVRTVC